MDRRTEGGILLNPHNTLPVYTASLGVPEAHGFEVADPENLLPEQRAPGPVVVLRQQDQQRDVGAVLRLEPEPRQGRWGR